MAELLIASDAFARTAAIGWGAADIGGTWTNHSGNNNRISVNGSHGVIAAQGGGGSTLSLPAVTAVDTVVTGTYTVNLSPANGGAQVLITARQVGTAAYRLLIWHRPDGATWLIIQRYTSATTPPDTNLKVLTTFGTWVEGRTMSVRFEVTGTDTVTLQGKAWLSTDAEPAAWTITATDTAPERLVAPGSPGLAATRQGSDTVDRTIAFDTFAATDLDATEPAAPLPLFVGTRRVEAIFVGNGQASPA